jgi:ABC-2 type transport system permease protein
MTDERTPQTPETMPPAEPAPAPAPETAAPAPEPAEAGWTFGKRMGAWINTVVMVLLMAGILVLANYLGARKFKRFDWTANQEYQLTEKTLNLLKELKDPVEVYCFYADPERVTVDDYNLMRRLHGMLDEYRTHAPQFTWEILSPALGKALIEKLKRINQQNYPPDQSVVVFAKGRTKTLTLQSMAEMQWGQGGRGRMSSFNGESLLTAAIQELTAEKPPVLYFAQGHGAGEGRVQRAGRGEGQEPDLQWIVNRLKERENIEHKTVNLLEAKEIPEDCKLLVIHRPGIKYGEKEIALLEDYLKRGGRLVLMPDVFTLKGFVDTGLEGLLKTWGVSLGRNLVFNEITDIFGRRMLATQIVVEDNAFGTHPIVDKLKKGQIPVLFDDARTVVKAEGADARLEVTPLITLESGWAETSFAQIEKRRPVADPEDPQGSLPLAQAVKAAVPADVAKKITNETRLVVFGSASFVNESERGGVRAYGNEDLFINTLLWLVDRERDIGIAAKSLTSRQISFDEKTQNVVFWICIFGLPGVAVAIGLGFWFVRRK